MHGLFCIGCNSFEALIMIFPDRASLINYVGKDFKFKTFQYKGKIIEITEGLQEFFDDDSHGEERRNKYFRKGCLRSDDIDFFEIRPIEFGVPLVMVDLD